MRKIIVVALACTLATIVLAGCVHTPRSVVESVPVATTCPAAVPATARCLAGQDSAGAYYLIALPEKWNGVLVLHAHGGPSLGSPKPERTEADLKRWAIMVKAGYAWAGSTFRQGGVAVRAAAEDIERLRHIFVAHVAIPKRTILHGNSWGANVAAKGAEMFDKSIGGHSPYDAVLLTSGQVAGSIRGYEFRLDLRVVYQYLCANHPKPDEPQYPLWMGLPKDSMLTRADFEARVNDCLGVDKPASQRTPQQQQKLKTIVDVIRIREQFVLSHLEWGTWVFQEIFQNRSGGGSPWGNVDVHYTGSDDDVALNARVLRYVADSQAVARLGDDSNLTGHISVPVLSAHAINDPTVFVEQDSLFLNTMQRAGTADHLVQTFTSDNTHSYLTDPAYTTLMAALLAWVESGAKPSPQEIAQHCPEFETAFGKGCRFLPTYRPAPHEKRVPARE